MNRRSFLSALARLGAAVVASPLISFIPESQAQKLLGLIDRIRQSRRQAFEEMAQIFEDNLWAEPAWQAPVIRIPLAGVWHRQTASWSIDK